MGTFSFGFIYSQVCNNQTFLILYHGIYRPHKDHKVRIKECFKEKKSLNHSHYQLYLIDIFTSPIIMIHQFLFKYENELKIYKQQMIYDLIEKYEFVNETIDNYDHIQELVKMKAMMPKQESYKVLNLKENYQKFSDQEKIIKDKLSLLKSLSDKDENSSDYEKNVYAHPKVDYSRVTFEEKFNNMMEDLNTKKMYNDLLVKQSEEFQNEQIDEIKQKMLERDQANIEKPKLYKIEDEEARKKRLKYEKRLAEVKNSQDPDVTENIKKIYGKGN